MADETTAPHTVTCAITGEETTGKLYVLKTTEGEELVSPEALFHNGADRKLARALASLVRRVQDLEDQLRGSGKGAKDDVQEQKKPAAPAAAKKTAAAKGGD